MSRSNPMHHSDDTSEAYAAFYAQRLEWANADEAARKAAYDAHYPDFNEHAAGMCDPRHSLSRFHDGVVVIPAALIKVL
jgi:hypothetical protein